MDRYNHNHNNNNNHNPTAWTCAHTIRSGPTTAVASDRQQAQRERQRQRQQQSRPQPRTGHHRTANKQQHRQTGPSARREPSSDANANAPVTVTSSTTTTGRETPELRKANTFDSAFQPVRSASAASSDSLEGTDEDSAYSASTDPEAPHAHNEENIIPRRNLTEEFEELYIEKPKPRPNSTPPHKPAADPDEMDKDGDVISPAGVNEIGMERTPREHFDSGLVTPSKPADADGPSPTCDFSTPQAQTEALGAAPYFHLHSDLQKDLSQALVNRVSFYAVIHDINKEATSMAANDDLSQNKAPDEMQEMHDPLVMAVNGKPKSPPPASSAQAKVALIDEETWLLNAIDSRGEDEPRTVQACPPTFLQAMGERDYENPLTSLSGGSRTQLWKPSRSWWEAKSGKNPWIEPMSHNKRWRYLWPLIHYHKFLARCIKKLKRNGVDVKTSISTVAIFLREEVCAVSDHLAAVSLFDSDKWMDCLKHFGGWTSPNPTDEALVRELIAKQKLRPIAEPGDVDSPLLRNQIDDHFLRAMASARTQMEGVGMQHDRRKLKERAMQKDLPKPGVYPPPPPYPGVPNVYQHHNDSPTYHVPQQVPGHAGAHQPSWNYNQQPPQWWNPGYQHGHYGYGDDASVQSGLSGDSSYPQQFNQKAYHQGPVHHPGYYPTMMYPPMLQAHQGHMQAQYAPMHNPMYPVNENSMGPEPPSPGSWVAPPAAPGAEFVAPDVMNGANFTHHVQEGMSSAPPSPQPTQTSESPTNETAPRNTAGDQTPYKRSPVHQVPMSPFWGHLDSGALALMGISSPQGNLIPQTPRPRDNSEGGENRDSIGALHAQPLLLRQQYYGYNFGATDGFAPPSPATQFMMSPQANFAFNYGYGVSPTRLSSQKRRSSRKSGNNSASKDQPSADNNRVDSVVPVTDTKRNRESPSTVETGAESESIGDHNQPTVTSM